MIVGIIMRTRLISICSGNSALTANEHEGQEKLSYQMHVIPARIPWNWARDTPSPICCPSKKPRKSSKNLSVFPSSSSFSVTLFSHSLLTYPLIPQWRYSVPAFRQQRWYTSEQSSSPACTNINTQESIILLYRDTCSSHFIQMLLSSVFRLVWRKFFFFSPSACSN